MLREKMLKLADVFPERSLVTIFRDLSYFAGPGFLLHNRREYERDIRIIPYENLVSMAGRVYFHLPFSLYSKANEILGIEVFSATRAITQVREKYLPDLDRVSQL